MLAALLWRDIFLNPVRKEYHANLVIVLYGAESQRGSNLGNHLALQLTRRTEVERTRDVDKEHHRKFALFFKHLDIRTVETGGYIPIDISHVVAILVFTNLGKGHTSSFEG